MGDEQVASPARKTIHAPWSPTVVKALNEFQVAGRMHPFTCANDWHTARPVLVATVNGWVCPDEACAYTQNWAHAFMANRRMWENKTFAGMLNRRRCSDMLPCGDASCRACYWRNEALSKGERLREESQLRQKLMKGLRLLKEWPTTVQVADIATWIQDLLTGGPGTHLQDLYGSGQEEPKRAVWVGPVLAPATDRPMTFKVLLGDTEYLVDIEPEDEKEFLMQVVAAHAGWSSRPDWRDHRSPTD